MSIFHPLKVFGVDKNEGWRSHCMQWGFKSCATHYWQFLVHTALEESRYNPCSRVYSVAIHKNTSAKQCRSLSVHNEGCITKASSTYWHCRHSKLMAYTQIQILKDTNTQLQMNKYKCTNIQQGQRSSQFTALGVEHKLYKQLQQIVQIVATNL